MRNLAIILIIAVSFVCCKKNNTPADNNGVCGVKNAMTDLPWLKAKIESLQAESLSGQVKSYRYNGQDIINIQTWIQSCYGCTLYTCSGELITFDNDRDAVQSVMNNLDELVVIGEF